MYLYIIILPVLKQTLNEHLKMTDENKKPWFWHRYHQSINQDLSTMLIKSGKKIIYKKWDYSILHDSTQYTHIEWINWCQMKQKKKKQWLRNIQISCIHYGKILIEIRLIYNDQISSVLLTNLMQNKQQYSRKSKMR